MTNQTQIAIVGAGKMGSAMLQSLKPDFPKTRAYDKGTDLKKELAKADVIILAVKPQSFHEIQVNLTGKLVISIMAGVSITKVSNQLNTDKIVRSMPNLPLQISEGLTGWIATKEVKNKKLIKEIFNCFGQEIEVARESDLDKITALSGSGPAYFFYLCELMQEKAEQLGFTKQQAKKIAEQTFIGSAKLLETSNLSAQEFRQAVTSKGGTTEAALQTMISNKMHKIFQSAIDASKNRCKELNQ